MTDDDAILWGLVDDLKRHHGLPQVAAVLERKLRLVKELEATIADLRKPMQGVSE